MPVLYVCIHAFNSFAWNIYFEEIFINPYFSNSVSRDIYHGAIEKVEEIKCSRRNVIERRVR